MSTYEDIAALIDKQLEREDLTAEDILRLTIAHRLNRCSDHIFSKALGGLSEPPLNFWGKR